MNRIQGRVLETKDDLLPGMIIWPDNLETTAWYYLALQEASNSNEYELKEDSTYKYWTKLIVNRNWIELEQSALVP